MWRLVEQAFVGRNKYESPKNDCVGGYVVCRPVRIRPGLSLTCQQLNKKTRYGKIRQFLSNTRGNKTFHINLCGEKNLDVISQKRVRVFHRGVQTREN